MRGLDRGKFFIPIARNQMLRTVLEVSCTRCLRVHFQVHEARAMYVNWVPCIQLYGVCSFGGKCRHGSRNPKLRIRRGTLSNSAQKLLACANSVLYLCFFFLFCCFFLFTLACSMELSFCVLPAAVDFFLVVLGGQPAALRVWYFGS